jgi:uncharacterized protein DUF1259
LIGKAQTIPVPGAAAGASPKSVLDTAKIAKIVGHDGEQNGAVYKITVGREDLKLKEMGAAINARMGLNPWAAFYGSNQDAAIVGDVATIESEVTRTLKALRSHGLDVVAIHNHKRASGRAVFVVNGGCVVMANRAKCSQVAIEANARGERLSARIQAFVR